jgi:hypothetical protein
MNAALDLADSVSRTNAGPKPVTLRTARDFSIATTALEHRVEDLEKLSKKTKEEKYFTGAREIDADIGAIKEFILPLFREQKELPLVTHDDLRATIKNTLHAVIHRFAVSSDSANKPLNPARTPTADRFDESATAERFQGKREEDLAESIGRAVAAFAVEIAESSYNAGLAARELTPEALAKRSAFALSDAIGS